MQGAERFDVWWRSGRQRWRWSCVQVDLRSVHTVSLTFDHRNKQEPSWAFMWVCVMLGHLAQSITPLEVTITKCMQHSYVTGSWLTVCNIRVQMTGNCEVIHEVKLLILALRKSCSDYEHACWCQMPVWSEYFRNCWNVALPNVHMSIFSIGVISILILVFEL